MPKIMCNRRYTYRGRRREEVQCKPYMLVWIFFIKERNDFFVYLERWKMESYTT